jgi:hypothetical protein
VKTAGAGQMCFSKEPLQYRKVLSTNCPLFLRNSGGRAGRDVKLMWAGYFRNINEYFHGALQEVFPFPP